MLLRRFMIIPIIVLSFNSCARWKVDSLNPQSTLLIPFGNEEYELKVLRNENGIFRTPQYLHWDDKFYYLVNEFAGKILIISRQDGEIKAIIKDSKPEEIAVKGKEDKEKATLPYQDTILKELKEKIKNQANLNTSPLRLISKAGKSTKVYSLKIGNPGHILSNGNGLILLESTFPNPRKEKQNFYNHKKEKVFPENLSKVLLIDAKPSIATEIWADNDASKPFGIITGMKLIDDKTLAIISRQDAEQWMIHIYDLASRLHIKNFTINADLIQKHDAETQKDEYKIFIENVVPRINSYHFFISAAFYKDSQFKSKRIYIFNADQGDKLKFYTEFFEPQNELFASIDGDQVYFWKSEAYNKIRLKMYNNNADLLNNRQMELFGGDEAWRNFFADQNGDIISLYVTRIGMEIIYWSK